MMGVDGMAPWMSILLYEPVVFHFQAGGVNLLQNH